MQSYDIKTIGGANIRQAREQRGFTQPELARMIRVSVSAVQRWENETRNILEQHFFPLINILGLKDITVEHT